jgi:outer membrane protein OmpA-like peptidoglycan-associated protein
VILRGFQFRVYGSEYAESVHLATKCVKSGVYWFIGAYFPTFAALKSSVMFCDARPYFFLLIFFFPLLLFAQQPAEAKRNGERAFANGRWRDAQMFLAQYQEAKPGDFGVLTKLGISLYHLRRGEEARRYLEYVAAKMPNSQDTELFYYLARCLHGLGEWEKAIAAYKAYLRVAGEKHPLRGNAADNIRRCVSGMQSVANEEVALVENLGDPVNSPGDEFAPLLSVNHNNRLYFAAARAGSIGGERNDEGYEDTQRGHWCSDMYAAERNNTGWEMRGSLGGLLNTSRFEVPLGFNSSGQILYFFRGFTLFGGEIFADTAARKDEYSLSSPVFESPVDAKNGDTNPYFFNDETLVFASRREGGFGGLDLWWTMRADSGWTAPVNFGPQINSPYDEDMPFLARDGATLYFSSNRIESTGGLDVFFSAFDGKKRVWQTPVNLGMPLNSPDDDAFFRLAADGRSAYLSSDRMGGFGQRDLYIVYFREALAAQSSSEQALLFTRATSVAEVSEENREIVLPTLAYTSEKDLLSVENQKVVDQIAALARKFPQTSILLTLHSEAGGQPKFDLYNGIKRAEMLGKSLVERGVPANRILLRSVGAQYPLAREILDGMPNPAAPAINRRVELQPTGIEPVPVKIRVERPFVSEIMAANGGRRLDEATNGLSYRVEVATTRQILTSDALEMFGDLLIESQPESGAYRYSAGLLKQYSEAVQLRKELISLGFDSAQIIACINGIRLSKPEAVAHIKKYPDLAGYLRG